MVLRWKWKVDTLLHVCLVFNLREGRSLRKHGLGWGFCFEDSVLAMVFEFLTWVFIKDLSCLLNLDGLEPMPFLEIV